MSRFIKPESARAIAYAWHGGMSCPMYAFASSGIVAHHGALLSAIRIDRDMLAKTKTQKRELHALYRFAQSCLALQPSGALHAPWAKTWS